MKKAVAILLIFLFLYPVYALFAAEKVYVSTVGFDAIKLKSAVSDKTSFALYKISSREEAEDLIKKIVLLTVEDESNDKLLAWAQQVLTVRNYEKESCYALISMTNDKKIINIGQPYHYKGKRELIFAANKKTGKSGDFYYMYLRIYIVDNGKDIYSKTALYGGNKIKLTADSIDNFLSGNKVPFMMMKAKNGMLLASNYSDSPFILSIKGSEIRYQQAEQKNVMLIEVDGLLIQFTTADIDLFYKGNADTVKDRQLLEMHRDWELAYVEQTLQTKLQEKHSFEKGKAGKLVFQWAFGMPESLGTGNKPVKKQIYTTARTKKVIVVLSGSITDNKDEGQMKKKLLEIMSSLVEKDTPVSVGELREKINE